MGNRSNNNESIVGTEMEWYRRWTERRSGERVHAEKARCGVWRGVGPVGMARSTQQDNIDPV